MADKVEIRTELLLAGQEQLKSELKAIKDRFGEADKGREQAQQGLGSWAATASHLASVVGTNLSQVVDRVRSMGSAFVDAGSDAESGDQAVAALIATAQGTKFDGALDAAEELGDRLDEVAISAGVSGKALGEAYQVVLERTGATADGINRAMAATEQLALVSAKLGKDVGAVTSEFSLMGEGMLRPRGQLFQLLQSTGIFGDKTKGVAEQWAKLTDEKRSELLSYGIGKLAGQMKDMPPTFKQASASFENMMRIGKEEIGQPLIEELTPALEDVTRELAGMRPEIQEFGKLFAKEAAGAIREGGHMLRDALSWVRDHKADIAEDIKAAAQAVRDAFGWVVAHKAEIAIAMGAAGAARFGPGAVGGARGAIGAAAGVGKTVFTAGEAIGTQGLAAPLGAAGGGAAALMAFAAAIAAVGFAAYQGVKLLHEQADAIDTEVEARKGLIALAQTGNVEEVRNIVSTMSQVKGGLGQLTPELRAFYEGVSALSERAADMRRDESDALRRQIEVGQRGAAAAYAAQTGGDVAGAEQLARNQVAILTNAYNQAVQGGNQAMALMAAQTIGQSALLKDAFLKSTSDIEGGFDAMASMLVASGGSFGAFATQLRGKGATPAPPKIMMTGGQTFNMKQDFRDKDPDKIAVLLRRDLGRTIERRAAARYAGPFGA